MPIAIWGFVMFPNTPDKCDAFWLTEEEKRLAITRLPPRDPNAPGHKLGWSLIKRVLFRPEL